MFLLIPPEQKKNLIREYHLRVMFVCVGALCVLTAIAIISFLPSYFYIHSKEESLLFSTNSVKGAIKEKSDEDLQKTLLDVKQNISLLTNEETDLYSIFSGIIEVKPISVKITHFTYVKNFGGPSSLILAGLSGDRASLLKFSKNLKAISHFENVDLPISNLAKESEIDFNINVTGNF